MDWIFGKSMDSSTPVGPYVVTKDEIEDPHNLRLTLRVNGEVEQDDNTRNLIFKIPELIHWASQGITLKPGDYISTGTPAGVGFPRGKFLKNGDVVEAEIEKIGKLVNTVVEE
jgi:2-keto-4-pentenoate hydratase/2-oxohepta-3-ene-1,7-dioic acid hydratase in catechol pathway